MSEIVEKDVKTLKSKGKKIRTAIKRTVIGIILSATILTSLSAIPNIEYYAALNEAKNSIYISEVLENGNSKTEQVKKIFQDAINSNPHLDKNVKERIINAFSEYVLEKYAEFFTKKNIENMYAVAKTERAYEMSSYYKEHNKHIAGSYNSYKNRFVFYDKTMDKNLAHEQLHAITKKGIQETSFPDPYNGAKEAITGMMTEGYREASYIINNLSLIIGYDKVIPYYLDGDIEGFKKELSKYISIEEANKFLSYLSDYVNNNSYLDSLWLNSADYNEEEYEKLAYYTNTTIYDYLVDVDKKICIAKTNSDSKYCHLYNNIYGQRRSGSDELRDLLDKNINTLTYDLYYYDECNVLLTVKEGTYVIYECIIPYDELGNLDIADIINNLENANNHERIQDNERSYK